MLALRGCDNRAVCDGEGNTEDRYVIVCNSYGLWEVYYSERGQKLERREFATEAPACQYLVELLNKDETVWSKEPS